MITTKVPLKVSFEKSVVPNKIDEEEMYDEDERTLNEQINKNPKTRRKLLEKTNHMLIKVKMSTIR